METIFNTSIKNNLLNDIYPYKTYISVKLLIVI